MHELSGIAIGILVLMAGVPLGDFLYRKTKEEIGAGQKWFGLIIIMCFLGAIISVFFVNDFLFFSFLFIAIVTSRSLIRKS